MAPSRWSESLHREHRHEPNNLHGFESFKILSSKQLLLIKDSQDPPDGIKRFHMMNPTPLFPQ